MDSAIALGLMVLKVTCVLLIALCATLAMQRASAGSRHLVWLTALAALLVVPALAVWQPLKVIPWKDQGAEMRGAELQGADQGAGERRAEARSEGVAVEPVQAVTPPSTSPAFTWDTTTVLRLAVAIWAAVAFLLLAWLAWGAWQVRRIVRRSDELSDPSWQTPLYEIADRLGLDEAPRLVQSDDVKMPFAAGLQRSTIVLPSSSREWNAERRSAVLIHELAHVKRRDLVGHTLGRVACALYWFHPMVWSAARHLRAESERACDDLALTFGTRPSEYAEHLLDIVTCVRDHATPSVALAMAHRKEFEGRMLAILNPELTRSGMGRLRTAGMVSALVLMAAIVGAAGPASRNADAAVLAVPPSVVLEDKSDALNVELAIPQQQDTARAVKDTPRPEPRPEARPAPKADPTPSQSAIAAIAMTAITMEQAARDPKLAKQLDSINNERIKVLAKALRTDPEASVRRVAAWGLADHARHEAATSALVAAATGDADMQVREMAVWALAEARPTPEVKRALTGAAQAQDASLRRTAIWAIGNIGDPSSIEALLPALKSEDAGVRAMAAWAIGSTEPRQAPAPLVSALQDSDAKVRRTVTWALYTIEDPSTLPALEAAFAKETDAGIRRDMVRAMGNMGDAATDALTRLVSSNDKEIRTAAISALAGGNANGPWPWPWPWPRPNP